MEDGYIHTKNIHGDWFNPEAEVPKLSRLTSYRISRTASGGRHVSAPFRYCTHPHILPVNLRMAMLWMTPAGVNTWPSSALYSREKQHKYTTAPKSPAATTLVKSLPVDSDVHSSPIRLKGQYITHDRGCCTSEFLRTKQKAF